MTEERCYAQAWFQLRVVRTDRKNGGVGFAREYSTRTCSPPDRAACWTVVSAASKTCTELRCMLAAACLHAIAHAHGCEDGWARPSAF